MTTYDQKTVVLSGANRGIGLALAHHFLRAGAVVYAGARQPSAASELHALREKFADKLVVRALDVTDAKSVQAFCEPFENKAVDFLVNSAGVNLDNRRALTDLPPKTLTETFETNAVGPFRMVQALFGALRRADKPVVANISSVMGSVQENESGGNIAYRMSKSAVNMFTKCLAIEHPELIALTLHPGWVRTRMGGEQAQIDVETSAKGLLKVIGSSGPNASGGYYRYSGETISW